MADKTYVKITPIGMKETFDKKYQSSMPKIVTEAFTKAVDKSSKLTTKPSSDKKARTLSLDGTLTLTKSKKGIEGKLSFIGAEDRSMFAMGSSTGSIPLDDPDKVSDSDVEALVEALVDDAQGKMIKEFEKKAK